MKKPKTMAPKRVAAAAGSLALLILCVWAVSAPAKDERGELVVDGIKRTYLVHAPESISESAGAPLVLALHGRFGSGRQMRRSSGFDGIADREGFIVAYPDGFKRSWADGRGEVKKGDREIDDVKFVSALIDELAAKYPVDKERVYACGMSNGGFMSMRLACMLSDKVHAAAAVGSTFGEDLSRQCEPGRAVPVMIVMGNADPIVPFSGGRVEKSNFQGKLLSAFDAAQWWSANDGCEKSPSGETVIDGADDGTRAIEKTWRGCRDDASVVLIEIENGGHTWPGDDQYLPVRMVGKTSQDFDASEKIWSFFKGAAD